MFKEKLNKQIFLLKELYKKLNSEEQQEFINNVRLKNNLSYCINYLVVNNVKPNNELNNYYDLKKFIFNECDNHIIEDLLNFENINNFCNLIIKDTLENYKDLFNCEEIQEELKEHSLNSLDNNNIIEYKEDLKDILKECFNKHLTFTFGSNNNIKSKFRFKELEETRDIVYNMNFLLNEYDYKTSEILKHMNKSLNKNDLLNELKEIVENNNYLISEVEKLFCTLKDIFKIGGLYEMLDNQEEFLTYQQRNKTYQAQYNKKEDQHKKEKQQIKDKNKKN